MRDEPRVRDGGSCPRAEDADDGSVALSIGRVMAALRAQARLYARLEECALRQRDLVSGEDAAPLLAVLADRQRLSTELAELGMALAPVRRRWDSFRAGLDGTQRDEADHLVAETQACLRRVMAGDEQDVRILSARRQLTERALRSAGAAGVAMAAYRPVERRERLQPARLDEAT